ncbi:hypothetical protein [Pyrococcus yayanosii]|uniref:Uncharacterized protein n=1 Tax=Pyrococcus yayanosii (strain CH1 / JCM 16557) TaxID=529709 RepID=F8AGX5_PYRYC|nr:hypothetical protein [Pyrococcus yayanosii]AEH25270.1 hypothetical protein PYCH_16040 [Pyrococcus yayanosii CH1]
MIPWEIDGLDEVLGGIRRYSLVLLHEVDPRSRGKELIYHIIKRKLEEDNLVGYFNISYPLNVVFRTMRRVGIDVDGALAERRLAMVDTFGSFYGIKYNVESVWYLEGSLSSETLAAKYARVIEAHKKVWAERGMFEGRELFGFAVDMTTYIDLFNSEEETLRYLEVSADIRAVHSAYRKYPRGTNFWVWSGMKSPKVFASVYRRADYVLRTRSYLAEDGVKRELIVLKTPEMGSRLIRFEYTFTKDGVEAWRVD